MNSKYKPGDIVIVQKTLDLNSNDPIYNRIGIVLSPFIYSETKTSIYRVIIAGIENITYNIPERYLDKIE